MDPLRSSSPPPRIPSTYDKTTAFADGPLGGRTVRLVMRELQKADRGRKYARKDRRPLDPPPVVMLQIHDVFERGTARHREVALEDPAVTTGLMCHVDLFPVPATPSEYPTTQPARARASPGVAHDPRRHSYDGSYSPSILPDPPTTRASSSSSGLSGAYSYKRPSLALPPISNESNSDSRLPLMRIHPRQAEDVVALFGEYEITEQSKCTSSLVGQTFVQPTAMQHEGRNTFMFAFSDLAVQTEGTFILRYRMFTMCPPPPGAVPILCMCYGGPFKVHASKSFPGLSASTELTKELSLHGVRLNVRENERKRQKKDGAADSPPDRAQREGERCAGDAKGKGRARLR